MLRRVLARWCRVTLPSGVVLDGELNPHNRQQLLRGVARLPDGRVYRGDFDAHHGGPCAGCELDDDGDRYRGEYNARWQRHGRGEAWLSDGTYYKGRFDNDELVEGSVRIPHGTTEATFEGTLADECFVKGRLTQHDFVYEGEFANNQPHGKGRLTFATGAVQEGTFYAGKLHGTQCKMQLAGGFVYVGEFLDGCIRRGTLYTPTYTYDGEFNEQGRAHGEGTQTYLANEPRLLFSGVWRDGGLVRGVCVDEHGTPVDWQNDHALQSRIFSDQLGEDTTRNDSAEAKRHEATPRTAQEQGMAEASATAAATAAADTDATEATTTTTTTTTTTRTTAAAEVTQTAYRRGGDANTHAREADGRRDEASAPRSKGEEAVVMNAYCMAKLREVETLFRDMRRSYVRDADAVAQRTGAYPSEYELGYEAGLRAEADAAAASAQQQTAAMTRVRHDAAHSARECAAAARRSARGTMTGEVNESMAKMQFCYHKGAQQLASERVDEQFERFMRTFDKPATSVSSRLPLSRAHTPSGEQAAADVARAGRGDATHEVADVPLDIDRTNATWKMFVAPR